MTIKIKISFFYIICLLLLCNTILIADSRYHIDTPRESDVPDTYDTDEISSDWKNYWDNQFSHFFTVIYEYSTGEYNCHGYAWHMSVVDMNEKVWIGYNYAGSEEIYFEEPPPGDGSYDEMPSVSNATHVSYSGDHSARTTSNSNYYVSKFGYGPRGKHHKDSVPTGYGSPNQFFRRSVDIPEDQSSINSALNAASGQTVHVSNGSYNLTDNANVSSGVTLEIKSTATINLGSYYIKSTGGTITNNGSVDPDEIRVVQSGVLKGYYPAIGSAASNAVSGQQIRVASGTYNENSITVPSGVLLDIYTDNPSVTIKFSSGSKLTVNGELKSNGEIYQGQGSGTSYWDGIYINGKATIINGDIKNASYGVKTTNCSSPTTISNNNIRDCSNGIVCYSGGSPSLTQNDFFNIQNSAIALNATPATVERNDIHHSNGSSCLLTSITTSGEFSLNNIYSSNDNGVWLGNYSSIHIEDCYLEGCDFACVKANQYATPTVSPDNTIIRDGSWSIYNENSNHIIDATDNTWENMRNHGLVETGEEPPDPDKESAAKQLFVQANEFYDNDKYEQSLAIFKNLIVDFSDSKYARDALSYIMQILENRTTARENNIAYFEDIKQALASKDIQNNMSAFIDLHILYWLQRNKMYTETEQKYDELLASLTEDDFEADLKFGKAIFYSMRQMNRKKPALFWKMSPIRTIFYPVWRNWS